MDNYADKQLTRVLSRGWSMMLLRGLAAIIFGILTWVLPGVSGRILVYLFGSFALVDGILGAWVAIGGRKMYEDWWVLLLWGLVGVGAGLLTFAVPALTAVALLFYIALWAIGTGVLEIVAAIRLRREIQGEWLLILGGLVTVAFGVLLMMQPEAGALAVVWMIGLYAIMFGAILMTLAFRIRKVVKDLRTE
jgi:uncharacterized membrane protein HdeD (DUF308 family)